MGLLDFIERGRERRAWLDDKIGGAVEYLTPPNLRPVVALGAQMNPIQGMSDSMSQFGVAVDPSRSMDERRRAAMNSLVEGALAVTPAAVAKFGYMKPAQATMEGLLGWSPAAQQIGDDLGQFLVDEAGNIRLPRADAPPRPRMYSPSLRSADNLKQQKGSYEQMRSMLIKGGAKDDELAWSGFDAAFNGRKTITKDEIADYLRDNTSMVDEVSDTAEGLLSSASPTSSEELIEQYVEALLPDETYQYRNYYLPERLEGEYKQVRDLNSVKLEELAENTGTSVEALEREYLDYWITDELDDFMEEEKAIETFFGDAEDLARRDLDENARYMGTDELHAFLNLDDGADASHLQYPDYFTKGAEDYTETRYTHDSRPSNWRAGPSGHWGDDNVLAHARTGKFPIQGGGKAHHVGEIQSDWAQDFRKRSADGPMATFPEEQVIAQGKRADFITGMVDDQARRLLSDEGLLGAAYRNTPIPEDNPYRSRVAYREAMEGSSNPNILSGSDAYAYLERSTPVEGGLPLGYGREQSIASDFIEKHGPRRAKSVAAAEAARDLERTAFEGAPYVDNTSKWVDMVLRNQLLDAIYSGADYMTTPNSGMVQRMTSGSDAGQSGFYDNIVPKRLKTLARKYDKKAQIDPIQLRTADRLEEAYGLRLTPEFVQSVANKGIPYFAAAGAGLLGTMNRDDLDRETAAYLGGI